MEGYKPQDFSFFTAVKFSTTEDVKKMIAKHQRALKMDIDVLRELQQGSNAEKLDTKILTRHLDEAKDTLMMIAQQIHFDR